VRTQDRRNVPCGSDRWCTPKEHSIAASQVPEVRAEEVLQRKAHSLGGWEQFGPGNEEKGGREIPTRERVGGSKEERGTLEEK